MKRKIILSICGAVGLLALIILIPHGSHQAGIDSKTMAPPASAPLPPPVETDSIPSKRRLDWRVVESTNYGTFIKNLRASGVPEQTVRDIVTTEINRQFDASERAAALSNRVEYWKTGKVLPRQQVRTNLAELHERLESERVATLKELLGDEAPIERRPPNLSDADVKFNLLDFMPVEERPKALDTINEIDATYNTRLAPRIGPDWSDNDRADYAQFCQQRDAKLLEALGPVGKEEYELRTSILAGTVRYKLRGLDVSEDEFRQLFRFAKQFEMVMDPFYINGQDPGQFQQNVAANQALR